MARIVAVVLISTISQYSPGRMELTIERRQTHQTAIDLPERLPRVDGYIAVKECSEIGDIWWAMSTSRQWERFLVVDCARPDDSDNTRTWMDERNIAFEVDGETAKRWGIVGRLVEAQWTKENPMESIVLSP